MKGLNKVMLIGNVGADPEMRYTPTGLPVVRLSLATTKTWNDDSGEKKSKTEWHRITAWRKTAEIVNEYVHKGSPLFVEGHLEYGQYEKDGITHYTTNVVAENVILLSSRPTEETEAAPDEEIVFS